MFRQSATKKVRITIMSKTITIPKELTRGTDDLVAVPRREYEEFLRHRVEHESEVELTKAQKNRLAEARRRMAAGKFLTIGELEQNLGIAHQ